MTYRLAEGSLKQMAAKRFGAELRRAMTARNVGQRTLAEELGIGRTTICWYLRGEVLPRLARANTMAAALDWPRLALILKDARTVICRTCGSEFLNDGGGPARYCPGGTCQRVAEKKRQGVTADQRADVSERRLEEVRATLSVHEVVVAEICAECEPGGVCHVSECRLRPVSPLSLHTVYGAVISPVIKSRATGRHSDERRSAAALRMRRRWAVDGARSTQGDQARAWWADLSPEQRAEQLERIHAGKRRASC